MTILFKFTSRSRPDRFMQSLASVIDNLLSDDFVILCSFDSDDESMYGVVSKIKLKYPNILNKIQICFGHSSNKIDAINRDVDMVGKWDILVNMSDDMLFHKHGFDEDIRGDYRVHFPDLNGAIHYPDGYTSNRLITLSIMGRPMYDSFGYIYHPSYTSLWCDNEFMDVARITNRYVFIDKSLFRHEHHANKRGAGKDELYIKNDSYYRADKKVYEDRKAKNFGL